MMEPMKEQWVQIHTSKGRNVCKCCLMPFDGRLCPHCGCESYYEKKEIIIK